MILAFAKRSEASHSIRWGERALNWDDFPLINSIPGDFHAMLYSDIQFEGNREDKSLRIYAQMIPFRSGRVWDAEDEGEQLLIHEQNHFNITEYHARLFRKQVINIGAKNLTNRDLQNLGKEYLDRNERMQVQYDQESEHNVIWDKQKYWELYIAGLLRETAYYAEEDIYKYQDFTGGNTEWFRKVQLTLDGELLTSYPENKINSRYGEVYQVKKKNDSIIVNFYKNGSAIKGGHFEAPVCIMTYPNATTRERHLFDENGEYISTYSAAAVARVLTDKAGNTIYSYYDGQGDKISQEGVYTKKGKWNKDERSFYYSFYDKDDNPVKYKGVFHELREMDNYKLTWRISYFDKVGKPMRDNNLVSQYEYEVNEQLSLTSAKWFDVDGKFAIYRERYHTIYDYDSRDNMKTVSFLNENGGPSVDESGIHKYTYSYDIYDNTTDFRKFNFKELPSNGLDEFHQEVNLFDTLGRITFSAKYHPDYILKFNDDRDGAFLYEYEGDSIVNITNRNAYGQTLNNTLGISLNKQFLNANKRVVKEEYFNETGYWAQTKDGVTSTTSKYDERGNQIEKATYDSLGKPRAWEEDVAISRWEYDDRNNKTKTTYFTTEGTLANAAQGVTYNLFKDDEKNNLSEKSYFDRNMNPAVFDGFHKGIYIFDRFGNDSIQRFYDVDNQIIKGPNIVKFQYNENALIEVEGYYDENNKATLNEMGVHKIIFNYDNSYRFIGYSYQGKYGEAINDFQGTSKKVFGLNPSGYVQSISFFDKHENPVLGPEGFHKLENHFNDMDELVRYSIYGPDQKLINNEDGIADFVFQVNNSGQIIRISFYDADANLTEDSKGVSEYIYKPSLNGLFYLDKKLNAAGEEIPQEGN